MDYLMLVNQKTPLHPSFVPPELREIKLQYLNLNVEKTGILLCQKVCDALLSMTDSAREEGVFGFLLMSGYRSFDYQRQLYEKKLAENPNYGKDAPPQVARPGESEHHTGLALDLVCVSYPHLEVAFAETHCAQWLFQNAHRFGFILRYPADKVHITGIGYEPWHYRYVGETAALQMHKNNLTLEEYLEKRDSYTL